MAIAQRKGMALWNGQPYNTPWIYGNNTKHVIVLTPDGNTGDGKKPVLNDSKTQNSDPSDDDIREFLSENICRCTGYDSIIMAVKSASKEMNA